MFCKVVINRIVNEEQLSSVDRVIEIPQNLSSASESPNTIDDATPIFETKKSARIMLQFVTLKADHIPILVAPEHTEAYINLNPPRQIESNQAKSHLWYYRTQC